ncbi:MAG: four helix bundle protein [Thermomicrobiales bacterium]
MHYRELIVWQKSMDAAKAIYRLVLLLPKEETFGMRSQLTRAVVSIPANIAEGWTRESPKERAHHLSIAHGSASETETLLTLCEEIGWFPEEDTVAARGLLDEISRMLTSMRRQMRAAHDQR